MNKVGFGDSTLDSYAVEAAYKSSFGDLTPGTTYAGGIHQKGYGRREEMAKAMSVVTKDLTTTTNEYASGVNYSAVAGNLPVLIPIFVDKAIIDITRRETPLYELLAKKAIKGKFVDFNQMTARGAATWRVEGAALPVADDTYARVIVPVKYAYAVAKVTGPAIQGMKGYIDILREQAMTHTQSLVQLLEDTIINGNAALVPQQFTGLIASIVTNVTALAGAAITIPILRTSIRQARAGSFVGGFALGGGNPNLIVTDLQTLDNIKALLQAWLRYPAPTASLAWGIQTVEFEGIPIIASKFMTTAANIKDLLILDTSKIYLAVLQDIVMEQLARTDDGTKFMIKWYGTLVVTHEQACAAINTIA